LDRDRRRGHRAAREGEGLLPRAVEGRVEGADREQTAVFQGLQRGAYGGPGPSGAVAQTVGLKSHDRNPIFPRCPPWVSGASTASQFTPPPAPRAWVHRLASEGRAPKLSSDGRDDHEMPATRPPSAVATGSAAPPPSFGRKDK